MVDEEKALTAVSSTEKGMSLFSDMAQFQEYYKIAKFLATTSFIPDTFKNPSDALAAIDIAKSIGESPIVVMQNMTPVKGRPVFSSVFQRHLVDKKFPHGSRYEWGGTDKPIPVEYSFKNSNGSFEKKSVQVPDKKCRFYVILPDGSKLYGEWITTEMAVKEGWWAKSGSKWPIMPNQMLAYRAVSFFVKMHCPSVTMAIPTLEEVHDSSTIEFSDAEIIDTVSELNAKISNTDEDQLV